MDIYRYIKLVIPSAPLSVQPRASYSPLKTVVATLDLSRDMSKAINGEQHIVQANVHYQLIVEKKSISWWAGMIRLETTFIHRIVWSLAIAVLCMDYTWHRIFVCARVLCKWPARNMCCLNLTAVSYRLIKFYVSCIGVAQYVLWAFMLSIPDLVVSHSIAQRLVRRISMFQHVI